MLTLQRASAGSGKTFTLTRTYIRLLISHKDENRQEQLLSDKAIAEGVGRILGVTFTNKATNEMKSRIVAKLHALTRTDLPENKVDYLKDFMELFGVSRNVIAHKCAVALKAILTDYSSFNISTIDSFFQSVLRTFAYETEIPENYRLEIDNTYVAGVGVDTVTDELQTCVLDSETNAWLRTVSDRARAENNKSWNVFDRKTESTSRFGQMPLYGRLINIASKTESEEFKNVCGAFERYFDGGHSLLAAYGMIEEQLSGKVAATFASMMNAVNELYRKYKEVWQKGAPSPMPDGEKKAFGRLSGADPSPYDIPQWKFLAASRPSAVSRKADYLSEADKKALLNLHRRADEAVREHYKALADPDVGVWMELRRLMPETGLLFAFRQRTRTFLEENNIMVLNDTNTLLRRIIADDEVPFIYERLGSRIDNYLIDEFQDTSRMQWDNFRPLLAESMGRDEENLIIGDAKQSIYRFRNADSSIITDVVPATFDRRQIDVRGDTAGENSNWRSALNIVQFNNYVFSRINEDLRQYLGNLYQGVVQYPQVNKVRRGYVEWKSPAMKREEYGLPEYVKDPKEKDASEPFDWLGPLVKELLSRGYSQRDIAILSSRNETSAQVIRDLVAFNTTLPEGEEPISFVSEQSLQLDHNESVLTVISAIRLLSDGETMPVREEDEKNEESEKTPREFSRTDWHRISNQLSIYAASHPEMSMTEQISTFLAGASDDNLIADCVASMQSTTLPALVEALVDLLLHGSGTFGGHKSDTPFLAALQDAVLDYCESFPADPASFIKWWDNRGHKLSVSSPEDSDAINIMTIHKSKGLEFECVILPDICEDLYKINKTTFNKWAWVPVPESFPYRSLLPDYLPVEIRSALRPAVLDPDGPDELSVGGAFADIFTREVILDMADTINKIYVAFTRPVTELYIIDGTYVDKKKEPGTSSRKTSAGKTDMKMSGRLKEYLVTDVSRMREFHDSDSLLFPDPELLREPVADKGIIYGGKPDAADVAAHIAGKHKPEHENSEVMENYFVNADQPPLEFVEEGYNKNEPFDEDTEDPRSEGSMIHAILERVEVAGDLHRACRHLLSKGMITSGDTQRYEAGLREALAMAEPYGWFDGSMRILAERPILRRGTAMRRPDRVMVNDEGDAVVVDYKTGSSENNSKHRRQVQEYMRRLSNTGNFRSVTGWLWYLREGKFQEVAPAKNS